MCPLSLVSLHGIFLELFVTLIIDSSFFRIPFGTEYHHFASLPAGTPEMSEVIFLAVLRTGNDSDGYLIYPIFVGTKI
jgi:hypothetical protein